MPDASIELVIFDCDGVVVDSERLTVEIEAHVLTELGWSVTAPEIVRRFVGRSSDDVLDEVACRIGRERAHEFDRVSTEQIVHAFRTRLQPVDGVAELVQTLHAGGVATCIASSGSHRKMRLTLGVTGMYDMFAGRIFSASEVARGKPAPDLFLHAAASMGVEPRRCAVIEDSIHGVHAAAAAGMACIGFAGGLTERVDLESAGAFAIDSMAELTALATSGAAFRLPATPTDP